MTDCEVILLVKQVLVEGVGVFGIALGKGFEEGGFLALVLYPLLEKLASTNHNVRDAAEISLRAICIHSGYHSVQHLPFLSPLCQSIIRPIAAPCRKFCNIYSERFFSSDCRAFENIMCSFRSYCPL